MSLTSALKNPNSPMSFFLAIQLPTPNGVLDALRAQLPPRSITIAPQGAQRFNYRSLGRAIDRRLRVAFGAPVDAPLIAGVGFAPGEVAAASSLAEGKAVKEAGQGLLAALQEQPAAHDGVMRSGAHAEERLARLCYAASHFEEVYRAGLFAGNPLLELAAGEGLEELLDQVPNYVPGDLARQVTLAQAPDALGWVAQLPVQERLCAPVFAGSCDVGGADADFIAAGMLIDCKATINPQRIDASAVRQLAGYLLLDYPNEYRMEQIGVYLSRQGRLVSWPVTEFLQRCGAHQTLPELRAACQQALTTPEAPRASGPPLPDGQQQPLFD
ncbi:hypothetical protein OG453_44115 [Streptomyces sp. NBC_01381]|uniref:hypothetical protein n=1 Tax=Streptomyces sp. NBC_01381 TaxID=2903845 RepID=UPI00225786E1|nr:hypothetical protein [Streptomyces sp. NBC_01381]MCX4673545.1 hypothetical protein [Streptomyces sp. NBC_01381]